MDRTLLAGGALTGLGVVGYGIGVAADVGVAGAQPYPGRAFSVTGVMIGITLLAVGAGARGDSGSDSDGRDESRGDGYRSPGGDGSPDGDGSPGGNGSPGADRSPGDEGGREGERAGEGGGDRR